MKLPEVFVVRTGTANVASVCAALARCGAEPRVTRCASEVRSAERVVLPGVGAFDAARAALEEAGLVQALRRRFIEGRATLAICLGLQLLGRGSEESPGVPGLGLVPCVARRFSGELRVPQIGWNRVEPEAHARLLTAGHAYFANTYRFVDVPAGWTGARADYGGSFVAALERGALLACQFHPELSGSFGSELLRRWLARGGVSC